MDKVLLFFALKYNGNWDKIYDALDKKEKINQEELDVVETKINCKYLTIINPVYPNNLKNSYKPPFVLFYQGNINLLVNYYKIIGVVEEIITSPYSLEQTKKIVQGLEKEKKTILTLGSTIWNKDKKENQIKVVNELKLVEHEPKNLIIGESFALNNSNEYERLVFGMSSWIFVSELKTTNKLFENLKLMVGNSSEIFVLPQENNNQKLANNWLIKQGAKLVEQVTDLLNEF